MPRQAFAEEVCRHTWLSRSLFPGTISSFEYCVFLPSKGLYAASCPVGKDLPFQTKGKRPGWEQSEETYKNLEWVDQSPPLVLAEEQTDLCSQHQNPALYCQSCWFEATSTNESPHQSLAVRVLESTLPLTPFPSEVSPTCQAERGYWVVSAVGWE